MQLLQQSEGTAAQRRLFFQAVDATNGIDAETGLTGAGRISKNGAATAASSATITEIDSTNMPGRYFIELTAAEVDTLGIIVFRFKDAACAEVIVHAQVVPWDPYDAVRQGMTALPNAAADAAGGLPISDLGGLDLDARLDAAITSRAVAGDSMALTAAAINLIWDELISEARTALSIGQRLKDAVGLDTLTAARVTLLDEITAVRLAELDAANLPADLDAVLVDTNSLNDTKIPDTISLANIQTEVELALEDAGLVQVITTIATLTSQTDFTLTDGSADNDAYNDSVIIVEDVTTAAQKAIGLISDYVGATKQVLLTVDPAIFTIVAGDKVAIIPKSALFGWLGTIVSALISGRVDANAQVVGDKTGYTLTTAEQDAIVDKVWDELQSGHVTANTFGEFLDVVLSTRSTPAQVNTEVSDVIKTDTIAEIAQGIPDATPTLEDAIMLIYMALRNKLDITSSFKEVHNDAGTVITKKALTDDATTYSEAEMEAGP